MRDDGVRHATECWSDGYNCAESVLRGVCFGMEVELPNRALMIATPFGGGIGRSGDICGALVGGIMAVGALKGRTTPEQDRLACYEAANRLYKRFSDEFGSTCCRVLNKSDNKSDFRSSQHRERCGRFVAESTSMSIRILQE
jgi:C_GCAxxG_C_C family probable redox protein